MDGHFVNATIPPVAISDFVDLIDKIRNDGGRWSILEQFKRIFGAHSNSSSESWAHTDLWAAMESAAQNAPLFIESFYDGCEELRSESGEWFVPDASIINAILAKHGIGYDVQPPNLVLRELHGVSIEVEKPALSIQESARNIFEKSLIRSEELLREGHPREAVQEVLWLLETVATAFKGIETQSGKIEGKYFNKIVGDLRGKHPGTTLERVLEWITAMHGYLSSPGGGGVRHGVDVNRGVELDFNQARLFCNLTRSYISFLIVEHDSLIRTKGQ